MICRNTFVDVIFPSEAESWSARKVMRVLSYGDTSPLSVGICK